MTALARRPAVGQITSPDRFIRPSETGVPSPVGLVPQHDVAVVEDPRAQAIDAAIHDLGLRIRAGVHTGEVELDGDAVRGIAVHIGARVAAMAGPSEVLVSQTVKDLVAGSGLTFEDAGEHELKGIPDRRRLYRVAG